MFRLSFIQSFHAVCPFSLNTTLFSRTRTGIMPSDDDGTDFGSNGSDSDDPLDVISSSQPRTDTVPSGDDGTDFKFEYSGSESDDLQERRVSTPAVGASEKECLHAHGVVALDCARD